MTTDRLVTDCDPRDWKSTERRRQCKGRTERRRRKTRRYCAGRPS